MSNKVKRGFALKQIFVGGELHEPGDQCVVPEGDANYLTKLGRFTADKAKAAEAKKAYAAAKKEAAAAPAE